MDYSAIMVGNISTDNLGNSSDVVTDLVDICSRYILILVVQIYNYVVYLQIIQIIQLYVVQLYVVILYAPYIHIYYKAKSALVLLML